MTDYCINCGLEVTDPTNPNEETRFIHLVSLKEPCDPEYLHGAMADEQRAGTEEYVAYPEPPEDPLVQEIEDSFREDF